MTPVTAGKVKYGVWGLICGAVIAMILGFAWGGWTTERTTQRMGEEAVLAARAAICVAQFMKDPNHEEQLQALGKLISYQRGPFIETLNLSQFVEGQNGPAIEQNHPS